MLPTEALMDPRLDSLQAVKLLETSMEKPKIYLQGQAWDPVLRCHL